jgi:hypothetical protein
MLEQTVPNLEMRSEVHQPRPSFFSRADELPFQEKTLLWYHPSGCKTLWDLLDSLLLPYILSIAAILGSTFTLFTNTTVVTLSELVTAEHCQDILI